MYRSLPLLSSLLLLLGYGLADGYWTDRWSLSRELAQAPVRLAALPRDVGEWQGKDDEVDPRHTRRAELRGCLLRRYSNRRTGELLHVLLVGGRPGPITVHSPEVCLGGAGFQMNGTRTRQEINAPAAKRPGDVFWVAQFHNPNAAVPEIIEMYWAWHGASAWQAADNPRLDFASQRVLYKLYVTRAVVRPAASAPEADGGAEQAPIHEFLKVFLPEVKSGLFPE
jgi:hypothetical protein